MVPDFFYYLTIHHPTIAASRCLIKVPEARGWLGENIPGRISLVTASGITIIRSPAYHSHVIQIYAQ